MRRTVVKAVRAALDASSAPRGYATRFVPCVLCWSARRRAISRALFTRRIPRKPMFDVVHQTIQLPSRVNFRAPARGTAVEALVVTQTRKDRFDRRETPTVLRAPDRRVESRFHFCGLRFARRRQAVAEESDMPHRRDRRH